MVSRKLHFHIIEIHDLKHRRQLKLVGWPLLEATPPHFLVLHSSHLSGRFETKLPFAGHKVLATHDTGNILQGLFLIISYISIGESIIHTSFCTPLIIFGP